MENAGGSSDDLGGVLADVGAPPPPLRPVSGQVVLPPVSAPQALVFDAGDDGLSALFAEFARSAAALRKDSPEAAFEMPV